MVPADQSRNISKALEEWKLSQRVRLQKAVLPCAKCGKGSELAFDAPPRCPHCKSIFLQKERNWKRMLAILSPILAIGFICAYIFEFETDEPMTAFVARVPLPVRVFLALAVVIPICKGLLGGSAEVALSALSSAATGSDRRKWVRYSTRLLDPKKRAGEISKSTICWVYCRVFLSQYSHSEWDKQFGYLSSEDDPLYCDLHFVEVALHFLGSGLRPYERIDWKASDSSELLLAADAIVQSSTDPEFRLWLADRVWSQAPQLSKRLAGMSDRAFQEKQLEDAGIGKILAATWEAWDTGVVSAALQEHARKLSTKEFVEQYKARYGRHLSSAWKARPFAEGEFVVAFGSNPLGNFLFTDRALYLLCGEDALFPFGAIGVVLLHNIEEYELRAGSGASGTLRIRESSGKVQSWTVAIVPHEETLNRFREAARAKEHGPTSV
jgi:DNA-directed RNA polymerase subunit RPC12/RpoP